MLKHIFWFFYQKKCWCSCYISEKNFPQFYQQRNYIVSKLKSRQSVNYYKRIPACPRKIPSFYQNKKLPRNLALSNFGILIIIFSTKINLLCVLFLIMLSCYLLDLIKTKGFLKPFLSILILKSHAAASVLPVFVLFSWFIKLCFI